MLTCASWRRAVRLICAPWLPLDGLFGWSVRWSRGRAWLGGTEVLGCSQRDRGSLHALPSTWWRPTVLGGGFPGVSRTEPLLRGPTASSWSRPRGIACRLAALGVQES